MRTCRRINRAHLSVSLVIPCNYKHLIPCSPAVECQAVHEPSRYTGIRLALDEVITSGTIRSLGQEVGAGDGVGVLSTYHPDIMAFYLTPKISSHGWWRRRGVLVRSRSYALGRRSGITLSSMAYDPRKLPFDTLRLSSVICISGHISMLLFLRFRFSSCKSSLVSSGAGEGGDNQSK